MKFLRAILAGFAVLGAGIFIGRSFPPSPGQSDGPSRVEERVTIISEARESPPGAPAPTLEPNTGKPEPLTIQGLRAELAALEESGGMFGDSFLPILRKWADLRERLIVSDIAAIAADIAAEMCSTQQPQGHQSGMAVLQIFAEADPQAAWNLAINLKQGNMKPIAVMAVFSAIAQNDPARALSMADSLTDPELKRHILPMVTATLAQNDPQRALALAAESSDGPEGKFSLDMALPRNFFDQWVRKDPEGAKAAVSRLSGKQAEQALRDLVPALAKQDSQAALKAALTIGESSERRGAVSRAVLAWADSDFPAALQYAVSVDDPDTRGQILLGLSYATKANRKQLLDAVMDHFPPGDNFQTAFKQILWSWAQENPAEAAAAARELPPGRALSDITSDIAGQWSLSAPDKQDVIDWARSLPEGAARDNSLRSAFITWSTQDPQAAMRALTGLTYGERKNAVQAVASGWSRTAPEAVLQWSSSLADASERADVVRAALSNLAWSSPESAAKFVERMPEADRSAPMEAVVGKWASRDTASAAAWLDRQPAGLSKDASLRTLSRKIAQEDPEAALTWARGISDEKDRLRQTESIARDWLRQDPNSARSWISNSTLPEETRKRLLK